MNKVLNIVKDTYINDVKPYITYDIAVIVFGVAGGMLLKYIAENSVIIQNIMKFFA